MNESVLRSLFSLLCNSVIVFWTGLSLYRSIYQKDKGFSAVTFRYFTTDSNVLSALCALCMLPFCVAGLLAGRFAPPAWVILCKYVGTVSVSVTFLTVMVFLGPTMGYSSMFAGDGLYLHLIGPLLAAVSFCLPEAGLNLTWGQSLLGLLPTFLYGSIYLVMAVFRGEQRGGWEDFYGFNRGGKWPVSYVMMHLGTYILCALLLLAHNR